ncbi:ecdysteroid-phosphate phosphatase [Danaus plexippus plexippus]|uniref:Ecdysteroid-phosphate phosphatase n=1 Tax=Danaus plexippus plexippus TaxID=278856 RepID=A0A212F8Z2_DANPL|nr:ecdysteroid-phosphate phosphatase [Danaus plexippus plexippus]
MSSKENELAYEKSEEIFKDWEKLFMSLIQHKAVNALDDGNAQKENKKRMKRIMRLKHVATLRKSCTVQNLFTTLSMVSNGEAEGRWVFALRHGERVDLTYGSWIPFCFTNNDTYVRKDLNMPVELAPREGGAVSYSLDTPLTRVGALQAYLVGEALRLAGITLGSVYASCALRSVETAHHLLMGLQGDPSVKIKVEPGLFEYKDWSLSRGLAFMTPLELHKAGFNIDLSYKPYIDLNIKTSETMEELYKRHEYVMQSAVKDPNYEGQNLLFVGHAITLEMTVTALKYLNKDNASDLPPYKFGDNLMRVPYCALGALRQRQGNWTVVKPPVPPSINTNSARYDWKDLLEVEKKYE